MIATDRASVARWAHRPPRLEHRRRVVRSGVAWLGHWWATLVFAAAGIAVTIHVPYNNHPVIRSDGLGYHAWTKAILDGNPSFCDMLHSVHSIVRVPATGRCVDKYAPGLALLLFPVMAPLMELGHGQLVTGPQDTAQQWAALVAGVVAVAATLACARRLGVRASRANLAVVAIAFGTGLFHYATYDSSFTHVFDAAVLALLLLAGIRYRQSSGGHPRAGTLWAIGLLCFFLIDLRLPSVLVVVAAGAVWLLYEARRSRRPLAAIWEHRGVVLAGASGSALAGVVQLGYNWWVFGHPTANSYAGEGFSPTIFHQPEVVFGFHKGLVTWYPIVLVAFVLALVTRRWWALLLFAATTAPPVALYGAWEFPGLGGGFGMRGFVDLAGVYGITLAVGFEAAGRWLRLAAYAVSAAAVYVTLGLMVAYWGTGLFFGGMDYRQWRLFGLGNHSLSFDIGRLLFGAKPGAHPPP